MSKDKISGVLVVYNEEKKIKKCLETIKDVVDEIVVIHDGDCSDKTLDIFKKYKNIKIYVSKFNVGEAEPHRPNSVKFAKYNWVLSIDADERLSKELKRFILDLKKNNFKCKGNKVDLLKANWPRVDGNKIYNINIYKAILFNKMKASILGIPHFSWQTTGNTLYLKNHFLLHEQMDKMDIKSLFTKSNKWSKVHAKYYLQYFYDKNSVTNFNYDHNSFSKNTVFRIRFPILALIPLLCSTILRNLHVYRKLNFIYATKKVFNLTLYQFLVSIYLFYYKIRKFDFKIIDESIYFLYK